MLHTLIVPGVGDSEYEHWQSWLERQLEHCSRVVQHDWKHPKLDDWVQQCAQSLIAAPSSIQIVAHSFGCLTSVATLAQYPQLAAKVKKMLLVAPANPQRFSIDGFATAYAPTLVDYFNHLKPILNTEMLLSENDPWFEYRDAVKLAQTWQVPARNMGQVGHINVSSGFGPFPEIFEYLHCKAPSSFITYSDNQKLNFKFAF